MRPCVSIWLCICEYVCVYVNVCICGYVCVCLCDCVSIWVCMCICLCVYDSVYMFVCIYEYVYVYAYDYLCVYVHRGKYYGALSIITGLAAASSKLSSIHTFKVFTISFSIWSCVLHILQLPVMTPYIPFPSGLPAWLLHFEGYSGDDFTGGGFLCKPSSGFFLTPHWVNFVVSISGNTQRHFK